MAFNWQTEFYRYRHYFLNIRRFYQQRRVRVYTEIVLTLLTTSFFLFFAVKPTLVTIAALIKEIKDKRMVAQKLGEKINSLSTAQNEYFAIEKDLYLIDQALPKDSQISLLVRQLEFLAFAHGVSLERVQYSTLKLKGKPEKEGFQEIEFKMALTGGYRNLKNFLGSLNNFRRIIYVEGFNFKKGKSEEILTLNISGKTFFLGGKNE